MRCAVCPAEIIWAEMPSGSMMPLDVEQVAPDVAKGVVAFNPRRETATMLSRENIDQAAKWASLGVTFHRSHFSSCPARDHFKAEEHFHQESLL